jgi:hypothetical protein
MILRIKPQGLFADFCVFCASLRQAINPDNHVNPVKVTFRARLSSTVPVIEAQGRSGRLFSIVVGRAVER